MPNEFHIIQPGERCRYLRSKGMFINAGLPPGEEISGDGHFWCGRNQRNYGPDESLCDGDRCRDTARSCYEGL
jgi:hypothetical protein